MSLSSSTFLGLEDAKQFRGEMVQHKHEFSLKIYSGNSTELSVDLKRLKKTKKDRAQFTDLDLNKLPKVHFFFSPVTCRTRQLSLISLMLSWRLPHRRQDIVFYEQKCWTSIDWWPPSLSSLIQTEFWAAVALVVHCFLLKDNVGDTSLPFFSCFFNILGWFPLTRALVFKRIACNFRKSYNSPFCIWGSPFIQSGGLCWVHFFLKDSCISSCSNANGILVTLLTYNAGFKASACKWYAIIIWCFVVSVECFWNCLCV